MKFESFIEAILVIVIIFVLIIFFLAFLILLELYNFIMSQNPPLSLRILLIVVFAINFIIAVSYAIKKVWDVRRHIT